MRKGLLLSLVILFSGFGSFAQFKSNTVRQAILTADTVLLVSHNMTYQKIVEDKPGGKTRDSPPIVINQKINWKIIHESVVLTDSLKRRVINILTRPIINGDRNQMMCFMPHHSILLITKGKTYFIEICFACQRLVASKEIGISDIGYRDKMWPELEKLFSSVGIKYQIDSDEDYNEIILHIRFKETDARLQQETLGILFTYNNLGSHNTLRSMHPLVHGFRIPKQQIQLTNKKHKTPPHQQGSVNNIKKINQLLNNPITKSPHSYALPLQPAMSPLPYPSPHHQAHISQCTSHLPSAVQNHKNLHD